MTRRLPGRAALAVCALAMVLGTAGAAGAATGLVTGTPPRSTGVLAATVPAGVVATPLSPGRAAAGRAVGRDRRYSLRLAPGLWLLTATTWGRRGPVETGEVLRVPAGGRRVVGFQTTVPTAVIVSVGRVMDPTGAWDVGHIVDVELAEAAESAPCDYVLAVDRESRAYREVLKELRVSTSRYVRPQDRAVARAALRTLAGTRPNYRVEGAFTALDGVGTTEGRFRVVDTVTGRVVWSDTVRSGSGSRAAARLLAVDVSKAVCGAPTAFAGTITSTITAPDAPGTWTLNAAAVFVLSDGGERTGHYALEYRVASLRGTVAYHADTGGGCTLDASYTGSDFGVDNGSLVLRAYEDGHRTYLLSGGLVTPPVDGTAACPGERTPLQMTLFSGYLSDTEAPWTGPILAGGHSGPWNPVAGAPAGVQSLHISSSWELVGQAESP